MVVIAEAAVTAATRAAAVAVAEVVASSLTLKKMGLCHVVRAHSLFQSEISIFTTPNSLETTLIPHLQFYGNFQTIFFPSEYSKYRCV